MNNKEYEEGQKRYQELAAKYYSDVQMTTDEIFEFVALRDIYEPVEEA